MPQRSLLSATTHNTSTSCQQARMHATQHGTFLGAQHPTLRQLVPKPNCSSSLRHVPHGYHPAPLPSQDEQLVGTNAQTPCIPCCSLTTNNTESNHAKGRCVGTVVVRHTQKSNNAAPKRPPTYYGNHSSVFVGDKCSGVLTATAANTTYHMWRVVQVESLQLLVVLQSCNAAPHQAEACKSSVFCANCYSMHARGVPLAVTKHCRTPLLRTET